MEMNISYRNEINGTLRHHMLGTSMNPTSAGPTFNTILTLWILLYQSKHFGLTLHQIIQVPDTAISVLTSVITYYEILKSSNVEQLKRIRGSEKSFFIVKYSICSKEIYIQR